MKVRYYLLIILTLLGILYAIDQGHFSSGKKITDLISISESLEFDKFSLKRKENKFEDQGLNLSFESKNVDLWFYEFSNIKIINSGPMLKTKPILSFKANNQSIQIHKVNELSGSFFILIGEKSFLAESTIDFDGVYRSDVDKKVKSFSILINRLKSFESYFYFNFLPREKISFFEREIIGSERKFSINFNENIVYPTPHEVLELDVKEVKNYQVSLSQLKINSIEYRDVFPFKVQAIFSFKESGKLKSFLYAYELENYLYDEEKKLLIQLSDESAQSLFLPYDDLLSGSPFKSVLKANLNYSIQKNNKSIDFNLDEKGQVFGIKKMFGKQVKQYLQEILCYSTFCHPKYKFYKFSEDVNKGDLSESFKISFGEHKLHFWFEDQLLKLYNPKQKATFSYVFPDREGKNIIDGLFK